MGIEKWYNRMMVTLTNMLLPGPDLQCASPWQFEDFYDIFLPNIVKGQKKSYHLSTEPLALCLMVNPALVFALRS